MVNFRVVLLVSFLCPSVRSSQSNRTSFQGTVCIIAFLLSVCLHITGSQVNLEFLKNLCLVDVPFSSYWGKNNFLKKCKQKVLNFNMLTNITSISIYLFILKFLNIKT